ncbi:hypothetical protein [Streptomyces sp. XD-27]|uniref:hypothetical protein n=1 Tax=Streptomyces sp. XD-27 TaxID=3062779 RepID=UPI0026F47217|nr:hypothetical protein [Streptomyces sp. XD-27]WKX70965.1 hypothetical protein Q3Y56_14550 [Streptomyces sp. XD-27]
MMKPKEQSRAIQLVGHPSATGDWCRIETIPRPPKDVHAAAGRGRLRPGFMPPMQLLSYILAAPFVLGFFAIALVFEAIPELVLRYLFSTEKRREEDRQHG